MSVPSANQLTSVNMADESSRKVGAMDFAFSEEQEFLRETARRFLEDKSPSAKVREVMATETGYDATLWAETASMGWQAMAIPEEYGGAGYSFLELAVLLEEMGRAVFPAPFLSTVVMAANTILLAGSEAQKQAWLPGIAAGDTIVSVALTEPSGRWDGSGVTMAAERDGDEWVLSGTKSYVLDGMAAESTSIFPN